MSGDGPLAEQQDEGEPPSRRGRPPKPIEPHAGAGHRAWLEPLRHRLFGSGLTLDYVAGRAGYSKARLSDLLRGQGRYPTWEITASLLPVLEVPARPVRWLWTAAAVEAQKTPDWIEKSLGRVVLSGPAAPPVDHRGFIELRRAAYTAYGRVFLRGEHEAERVVSETFHVLWMRWDEALGSADVQKFAWTVFRRAVMARTPHSGGFPDLTPAAFDTVALDAAPRQAKFGQFEESRTVFSAVGQLPDLHLDVVILHHMRGMPERVVAGVMGIPIASVRSARTHARRTLTAALGHLYLGGTPQ